MNLKYAVLDHIKLEAELIKVLSQKDVSILWQFCANKGEAWVRRRVKAAHGSSAVNIRRPVRAWTKLSLFRNRTERALCVLSALVFLREAGIVLKFLHYVYYEEPYEPRWMVEQAGRAFPFFDCQRWTLWPFDSPSPFDDESA